MPKKSKSKTINIRELEGKNYKRTFNLKRDDIDEEARTVALSFSSETPVERWFGLEVLDHSKSSVRLERLNTQAPLLLGHDDDDLIGVIESAEIGTDRKGRAVVRFGKSDHAEEIFQDVLDGIRSLVSVGYRVEKFVLEDPDAETPSYRAMDWEPFEVSLVSIPADLSVGVGRSHPTEPAPQPQKEKREMPDTNPQGTNPTPTPPAPQLDARAIEEAATDKAKAMYEARMKELNEITAIGEKHGCRELAQKAIQDGIRAEDFRKLVLEKVYEAKPVETGTSRELGMSDTETRNYSLIRAINAVVTGDWSQAGLEQEASRAAAKKLGRKPRGSFIVPQDVLSRSDFLNVTTSTEGPELVADELQPASFIEFLRNRMMVSLMGARSLSGLVGDLEIPRQTGGATAYYLGEDDEVTISKQLFDQVALSPHTVACMSEVTRKLLQQSSIDIENLVREDLAKTIAAAIDAGALHGSGSSNQPTGLASITGIGAVVGGENGAAPDNDDIIDLETAVAIDNADVGALGYLTNAKVRGKLKKTAINDTYGEVPIWGKGDVPGFGDLNGYRAGVTNQVSSTLTKGSSTSVCSAIFYGNWADLIIGLWGGLDILVDPFTHSARGRIRVTAFQDYDVAARHAASFAAMLDALTT